MASHQTTTTRFKFSLATIKQATCPPGKRQVLFWDSEVKNLGLRITASGAKTYVFEFSLHGRSGRLSIGSSDAWTPAAARAEAIELQRLVNKKIDPREQRQQMADKAQQKRADAAKAKVTFGEAWPKYIKARKVRGVRTKKPWSANHLRDHVSAVQPPGQDRRRSKAKTTAGPLYGFLDVRLADITADRLIEWLDKENQTRPTVAARNFRLLRSFLRWCDGRKEYKGLIDLNDVLTKDVLEAVAAPNHKDACMQADMIPHWFKAVQQNPDPVVSAYLEMLLLTGCRREEAAGLTWDGVGFRWRTLTIADKIDGTRTIGLTPFLAQRLNALPRRNQYVFSSAVSESGRLVDAYRAHCRALEAAGMPHLSLHDLRRSFATFSERDGVDTPAGVTAQIMGHRPSGTAEKHYKKRDIDTLREWHSKIEKWILNEAGIQQPPADVVEPLRAVQ